MELGARREYSILVTEALDGLPERYRLPVWLRHSEGFSWGEVAAALCVPEWRARWCGSRGLHLLHGCLAKKGVAVSMQTIELVLQPTRSNGAPETLLRGLEGMVQYGVREYGELREEETIACGRIWKEAGVWIAFLAGTAILLTVAELGRAMTDAAIGWMGG